MKHYKDYEIHHVLCLDKFFWENQPATADTEVYNYLLALTTEFVGFLFSYQWNSVRWTYYPREL